MLQYINAGKNTAFYNLLRLGDEEKYRNNKLTAHIVTLKLTIIINTLQIIIMWTLNMLQLHAYLVILK